VEIRKVTGKSRTRAGRPHAVFGGRCQLTHTIPCPCRAVAWP
jgi:hypothetical protein